MITTFADLYRRMRILRSRGIKIHRCYDLDPDDGGLRTWFEARGVRPHWPEPGRYDVGEPHENPGLAAGVIRW